MPFLLICPLPYHPPVVKEWPLPYHPKNRPPPWEVKSWPPSYGVGARPCVPLSYRTENIVFLLLLKLIYVELHVVIYEIGKYFEHLYFRKKTANKLVCTKQRNCETSYSGWYFGVAWPASLIAKTLRMSEEVMSLLPLCIDPGWSENLHQRVGV